MGHTPSFGSKEFRYSSELVLQLGDRQVLNSARIFLLSSVVLFPGFLIQKERHCLQAFGVNPFCLIATWGAGRLLTPQNCLFA